MRISALKLFINDLYDLGLVLNFKVPQQSREGKVDHISFGDLVITHDYSIDYSIQNYFEDLKSENYGLILCDGGLVQINYSIDSKNIVSHRYCYIPSPISFTEPVDLENLADQIYDVLDNAGNILLRSRVRFDFDRNSEFENHPESHLTMISPNCRIPLRGGLDVKRFFRFIFLNFIDSRLVNDNISYFRNDNYSLGSLSDQWASEIHLNWRS